MFNVSLSELVVVIIVAIFLIDARDIPALLNNIKLIFKKFNLIKEEILDIFKEEKKPKKRIIIDLEGNEHEAYELPEFIYDEEEEK